MDSAQRLLRTEQIFNEVINVSEPERQRILEARCGGDTTLMLELKELLLACAAEEVHRQALRGEPAAKPAENSAVGPYILDHLLGRGGMGAVYLAHRADGHFEQRVAIKLIDLPLASDFFRERLKSERQILASLNHPYIARLLDGGVSQMGDLYLAMEYIEGVPINTYFNAHSSSLLQRVQLFRKVCEAVQYAHQNLIVHRDLKPDNILITPDGDPRLLDFGTAKILTPLTTSNDDLTRPGMQTFTPQYASPEQVLGRPITTASDIYSLGVLLHFLLTGVMPYQLTEFTTEEMVEIICHREPPKPSAAAAQGGVSIDADLDAILLKALRKDPSERYSTVDHLSADLEAWLEHRPVSARRGDLRYKASRFVRRNRLALSAAALIFALAVSGVIGIAWQAHVADRNRMRAEARSADLRELSISLLSELDDALKQIPGSTGAQQLLVTRVLQHLDRMAKDSDGDRETQLVLIDAYTRLGNVQGNLYYQNVADTAGAIASFNRALALAAPLVAADPNDKEAIRAEAAAFEARGETLSDQGDAVASVDSLRAAVELYERYIKLPGVTATNIFEAAIAYETLGSELGEDTGLSDVVACMQAYRRALAMDEQALKLNPDYMAVRRGIPVMHMHLGNVVLDTDPAQALAEFELAAQLQSTLPADQQKTHSQIRLKALLLRKMAEANDGLGHYTAAVAQFEQARVIYQQLMDSDPKNASAAADMHRLLRDQAQMQKDAADPRLAGLSLAQPSHTVASSVRRKYLLAALDSLQQETKIIRQISAQSSSQAAWAEELTSVLIHAAQIRRELGIPAKNPADERFTLAPLREAAQSPHTTTGDIDLAVSAILELPSPTAAELKDAVAWAQHGIQLTHGRFPSSYLLLSEAYKANGNATQAKESAQKGLALLAPQDPTKPGFRLQKLLSLAAAAPGDRNR